MKWLFRKKNDDHKPPGVTEKAAERLVHTVLRTQRRIADRLNKTASGWSKNTQRLMLYLFCLLFGGGSMIVLVNAINTPVPQSEVTMPAPAIRLPQQPERQDMETIRQEQLNELKALQRRLDSLPADSISPQVRAQLKELQQMLNP